MADMSLADIKAVTEGNGYDGNGLWWIIILFFFGMFGGGFGNWGNAQGAPVTEAGLCNAMNFNNLENSVGRLTDLVNNGNTITQNGISTLGYQSLQQACNLQTAIMNGDNAIQRGIESNNYNSALNTASINETTTAQVQRVLDKMSENKEARLQARINQLEMQQAMAGVVRYPMQATYSAGYSPCFNGGTI